MKEGLSVIICCYNSAERLHTTLKHLALQIAGDIFWEIILVDNNSSDNTVEVAKEEWSNNGLSHVPLRIILEEIQGLSYARERGVKEAVCKYIIFCDDDNWLEKSYLVNAYKRIKSYPDIGAAGGQSRSVTDGTFPSWFSNIQEIYAVGEQAKHEGYLTNRHHLWGAGLIFKRALFIRIYEGFPSFLADRKGNILSSGGDSEICMRLLIIGYKLYYDPAIRFTHFIPANRLSPEYRDRLIKGFEEPGELLLKYYLLIQIKSLSPSKKLLKFLVSVLKYILNRFRLNKRFNISYDAMIIHFIYGFKLKGLTEQAMLLKKLSVSLNKKNSN